MPFYKRWRRWRWRRRPRRLWRRRFRRPLYRRFWRRKYRVRKRKLKYLPLRQWQPHYINKLKVQGWYPLAISTKDRLSNNLNLYLESIAPHYLHGGGGFTICNFSLMTLYQENLVCRNWWTKGNENMPLIRYLGCEITLYRQAELDYMVYVHNSYPMSANLLTYQSTCPQVMLMNNRTRIMPCKRYNRNKKPYKKFFVKPPSQLQNKWYFQKELSNVPLMQVMATTCSLDRMYLSSSSVSTTMGFVSLDTNGFMERYMKDNGTSPYSPLTGQIIFAAPNGEELITNIPLGQCILLGTVTDYTTGTQLSSINLHTGALTPPSTWGTYKTASTAIYNAYYQHKYWGNPFFTNWFHGDQRMVATGKTLKELCDLYKNDDLNTAKLNKGFIFKEQKWVELRYNPWADKGKGNMVYLLPINEHQHSYGWAPPTNKDVITQDLPLNILLWGYLDFHRKAKTYNDIDTTCILVIKSPYLHPKGQITFAVPLDQEFLDGSSPYFTEGHKTQSDQQYWHPKVRFQTRTVNAIACTGPGTTKLPPDISTEIHMKYKFRFKIGGEPAPMSVLKNPDDQPTYTIPNNLLQTTSLQSPTTPFEYLLWNFDERRGELTKRAAKRITQNIQTETNVLPITESAAWCPTTYRKTQDPSETSTSEEDETLTTEEKLLQQRREQKLLHKLIRRQLLRLTTLE
ncbi:ORF1 [Torque teno mini virus 9]|uniref:Capsid protein n=1 Tax=Torque teno mini virus 9 TaxID=687377 RepID=Q9JG64_9VIRU|nr:ORF1 [Torque teno mini virus 9]BAA93595.1 ORF1 [Torque teno mini virus 9]